MKINIQAESGNMLTGSGISNQSVGHYVLYQKQRGTNKQEKL